MRSIYTFFCCLFIITATSASDMSNLVGDHEQQSKITRGLSHIELLDKDELKRAQTLASTMSNEDLLFFTKGFQDMRKDLVDNYFKNLTKRNDALVFWSRFHERFAGYARGGAWLLIGTSAVLGIVAAFIYGGSTNWFSFAAVLTNAVGLGGLFLGSKSTETTKNLDGIIVKSIGQLQHMLSVLEAESVKRNDHGNNNSPSSIMKREYESSVRFREPLVTNEDQESLVMRKTAFQQGVHKAEELVPVDNLLNNDNNFVGIVIEDRSTPPLSRAKDKQEAGD